MEKEFFLLIDNKKDGPYKIPIIQKMLQDNTINHSIYAWTERSNDWKLVSDIAEFCSQRTLPMPEKKDSQTLQYKIIGTTMPLLEVTLSPDQRIFAQPGAMKWMSLGVEMTTEMTGGLGGALKRKIRVSVHFCMVYDS